MRVRLPFLTFALIAALFACNKPDPIASNAAGAAAPVPDNADTPDPLGGPPENDANAAAEVPAAAPGTIKIPVNLQGRWGLVPGDCTSRRGDAKGLLVITADELRFYESRAVPSSNVQSGNGTINGDFRFTGEGQSWDKFESLSRNGHKLTRMESNPTASYTYAKC